MSTWGPSKKTRASTPKKSSTGSSRSSSRTSAGSSRSGSSRQGGVKDATPPGTRRRGQAQVDLKQAVHGREHEFIGFALLVVGVLLGLAMYFDLAGPLGRGVETFVGWFVGLGRFVLPVVLVSSGVALVKKGQSSSPTRLMIGWGLIGVAVLGLLHIVREPSSFTDLDDIGEAGGWIGAAIAGPLEALVAAAGAIVVLFALFVGGVLLITSTSLKTMASHTGRGVGTVARPIGRVAKKAISDLSTLNSDREGEPRSGRRSRRAASDSASNDAGPVAGEPLAPSLYDGAAEDDALFTEAPKKAPAKRRKKAPAAQQRSLPIDGEQVGEWVLPPLSFLKQAGQQSVFETGFDGGRHGGICLVH